MVAFKWLRSKNKPNAKEKYAKVVPYFSHLSSHAESTDDCMDSASQWSTWDLQEKDPEKILGQYHRYHVHKYGKSNIPEVALYHTTSPYPGVVRVNFTPHLMAGLKVDETRLTRVSVQAHSLGVKPGWIVLFINRHAYGRYAYYVFGEGYRNQNLQAQLDIAVKMKEPCDITFFTDPAFWEQAMHWIQANQFPVSMDRSLAPLPVKVASSTRKRTSKVESKRNSKTEASFPEAKFDHSVDYSNVDPPVANDPRTLLEWYEASFIKSAKCMRPSSQFVKVQFYVSIPHGLKLKGREVINISDQAFLRGVSPQWMILAIWAEGKMILSPTCNDVEEQLKNAMMSGHPFLIGFFKNIPLWKRVDAAIRFIKEFHTQRTRREFLQDVPCATISLQWPVSNSSSDGLTEAIADIRLVEGIADLVKSHGVSKKDIILKRTPAKAYCTARVCSDASVLAVQEKLEEVKSDGTLATLIHDVEGHGVKHSDIQTSVNWPVGRMQKVIKLEHSCTLHFDQLELLAQAVSASRDAYTYAWAITRSMEPEEVTALEEIESMILFWKQRESKLMPKSEGRAQALKLHLFAQEAENLPGLLAEAEQAQLLLKAKFCPVHPWAEMKMNCTDTYPANDSRRMWASSVDDLAPTAAHFDPGIKSYHSSFEEAKNRQTALDDQPPINELVDVSHICIVFSSIALILQALQQILKSLDVIWVDNRFRNPSCLGYRDISIGVRQQVHMKGRGTNCQHISEVQLVHRELFNVKKSCGHRHQETIRSLLAKFGVPKKDVFGVHETIIRELDVTDGKVAQEEEHNAEKLMTFIADKLAQTDESAELMCVVDDAVKIASNLQDKRFADQAERQMTDEERRRLEALMKVQEEERRRQEEERRRQEEERRAAAARARESEAARKVRNIGIHDPCPCGSGKKYKKCHGRSSKQ